MNLLQGFLIIVAVFGIVFGAIWFFAFGTGGVNKQTIQTPLDERIVANIINKKENIKFQKDNYFTLNSSSSDDFFIFKNDDDISIHIGLDVYKTEINNKELSIILDNIKTHQSASREKEREERILKALGE